MNSVFQAEEPEASEKRTLAITLAYIASGIRCGAVPCAEDLLKRMMGVPRIDPAVRDAMKVAVDQMKQVGHMLSAMAREKAREAAEGDIDEICGITHDPHEETPADAPPTAASTPAPTPSDEATAASQPARKGRKKR